MSYDVTKPIERKAVMERFEPLNQLVGSRSVRHKADQQLKNAVFVGESEMAVLRQGLKQMTDEKRWCLYLEGLWYGKKRYSMAAMRESIDINIRYLMG